MICGNLTTTFRQCAGFPDWLAIHDDGRISPLCTYHARLQRIDGDVIVVVHRIGNLSDARWYRKHHGQAGLVRWARSLA